MTRDEAILGGMRGNTIHLGRVMNTPRQLKLPPDGRDKHLYICGGTGVGKSKLLEYLIRQDIKAWPTTKSGLMLLDPHGSVYENILHWLAANKNAALKRPVIPIDLRKDAWVIAYNVLRPRQNARASVIVDSVVQAMLHVWGATSPEQTPRFARWVSNLLHMLYDRKLTLIEAIPLLDDAALRESLMADLKDQLAKRDWKMAATLRPKDFEEQISSTINRLQTFLRNDYLRAIFGQSEVSLDLRRAIDEGAIILVNLSQEGAQVSKEDADLFATLLLSDLWTAAKERGKPRDAKQIRPFYVYADEFQNFVTPTMADSLDQARGYGLHMTMAHQFPSQLIDSGPAGQRLFNSVLANASSKVVFRTEIPKDLEPLAQWLFMGTMDPKKIKLQLHSTKVMGYKEETRTSTSSSYSSSRGGGSAHTLGGSTGSSRPVDPPDDLDYRPGSEFETDVYSDNQSENWSDSETYGETTSTVLIPQMGKELTHVQYESLEEQLFKAMQSLFAQEQRQCVVRLVGMRAPLSVMTPMVRPAGAKPEKVTRFLEACFKKIPYALVAAEAHRHIAYRQSGLIDELKSMPAEDEPTSARQQVVSPPPTKREFKTKKPESSSKLRESSAKQQRESEQPQPDGWIDQQPKRRSRKISPSAAKPTKPCIVVDGLNVIRCDSVDRPRMEYLLTVLLELLREGLDVLCFFDANTRHVLNERQGEATRRIYEQLRDDLPEHFVECTGGTQADSYILPEATERTARVVSNDRFKTYQHKFPWLTNEERLIRVKVVRQHIYLGEKRLPLDESLAKQAKEITKLLQSR